MSATTRSGTDATESKTSLATQAVALAEVQQRLTLFAEAMSGLILQLSPSTRPTDSQSGQDTDSAADEDPMQLLLRGSSSPATGDPLNESNGAALFLPAEIDYFPERMANQRLYRILVLRHCGYFEFGSFAFSYRQFLADNQDLAELVAARKIKPTLQTASEFERLFASFAQSGLARQIFALLEAMRIEAQVHHRYPGARDDLLQLQLARRDSMGAVWQSDQPSMNTLRLACLGDIRESIFEPFVAALRLPDATVNTTVLCLFNTIEHFFASSGAGVENPVVELSPLEEPWLEAELSTPDLVEHALAEALMEAALDELEASQDTTPSPDESGSAPLPEALKKAEIKLGNLNEGMRQTYEAIADLMQERLSEDGRPDDPAEALRRQRDASRAQLRRAKPRYGKRGRCYLYDEWDYLADRYRPAFCQLYEEPVAADGEDFLRSLLQRHRTLIRQIREQFSRLRAQAITTEHHQEDGEQIELDQAIELLIDRRAGVSADDRIYSQRTPQHRDVAAAFLLDISASTDTPIDPVPPPPDIDEDDLLHDIYSARGAALARPDSVSGTDSNAEPEQPRTVLDVQKDALALMSLALNELGDSYAIYGFSGYGAEDVEFHIARDFQSSQSNALWRRIGGMRSRRSTRMGPAIRHAIHKLNGQDASLKLLIILSDGFPQDFDYGPDRTSHSYGIRDTAQALVEAEKAGVESFCLTVDKAGHDYLRDMCPADRYMVIEDIETLPEELARVYTTLSQ